MSGAGQTSGCAATSAVRRRGRIRRAILVTIRGKSAGTGACGPVRRRHVVVAVRLQPMATDARDEKASVRESE